MRRTLVVTNDFPPRPGGIQQFVHTYCTRLVGDVAVYASRWRGWEQFDAAEPFPVVRADTSMLLPTPRAAREAAALAREQGCTAAWFGAAAPLGLLAPALRRAGIERIVATTHGHEVGWARLPASRSVLRRIARDVDVLTYLGEYSRAALAPALGRYADRLAHLPSGVDTYLFRPDVDARAVLDRHGLTDRRVVVCVSRLVPRKGQDTLIRALPAIRREAPDAALLIVGGGPYRDRLARLARECAVAEHVVFTGSVGWDELPAHYAAGEVFAMPCRTRRRGLEVEGLGIVYLEASATGLPVVAGDSGGAPEAVRDGETGFVVPGGSVRAVAARVGELLADPQAAAEMGRRGRAWVQETWRWEVLAGRLAGLIDG